MKCCVTRVSSRRGRSPFHSPNLYSTVNRFYFDAGSLGPWPRTSAAADLSGHHRFVRTALPIPPSAASRRASFAQGVTTSAPDAVGGDDLVALRALVVVVMPGRPALLRMESANLHRCMPPPDIGLMMSFTRGPSTLTAARSTDWVQPNFRDQYRTSRQLSTSMSGIVGDRRRAADTTRDHIRLIIEAQSVLAQMNPHVLNVLRESTRITQ